MHIITYVHHTLVMSSNFIRSSRSFANKLSHIVLVGVPRTAGPYRGDIVGNWINQHSSCVSWYGLTTSHDSLSMVMRCLTNTYRFSSNDNHDSQNVVSESGEDHKIYGACGASEKKAKWRRPRGKCARECKICILLVHKPHKSHQTSKNSSYLHNLYMFGYANPLSH